jgi:hypothetical protein
LTLLRYRRLLLLLLLLRVALALWAAVTLAPLARVETL